MGSIQMGENQKGLVSIVVTIIIMIVLSTVVVAFSQLVRREQRQSFERQLNTQAFYAAESGVNDAMKVIETLGVGALTKDYTSDCTEFADEHSINQTVGDPNDGVKFTCLLVDPSPPNIDFSSVNSEESKIFDLRTQNASDSITQAMVSWEDKGGAQNYSGCPAAGSFPQNWPSDCTAGIMRVDIVPFNGPMSRDDLANQTFTAFLHPRTGVSGNVSWSSGTGNNQGAVIAANCVAAADRDCKVQISGMPGGQQYYMRIKSLYRQSAVTICSPNCANPVELTGAQALIDATGRSSDVLKRIQVRVPISSGGSVPEAALQTNDTQCKRFSFTPTNVFTDSSDPACNPTN